MHKRDVAEVALGVVPCMCVCAAQISKAKCLPVRCPSCVHCLMCACFGLCIHYSHVRSGVCAMRSAYVYTARFMCLVLCVRPYDRSGADKVSIGSDSVEIAEKYLATGAKTGNTSIEQISKVSTHTHTHTQRERERVPPSFSVSQPFYTQTGIYRQSGSRGHVCVYVCACVCVCVCVCVCRCTVVRLWWSVLTHAECMCLTPRR